MQIDTALRGLTRPLDTSAAEPAARTTRKAGPRNTGQHIHRRAHPGLSANGVPRILSREEALASLRPGASAAGAAVREGLTSSPTVDRTPARNASISAVLNNPEPQPVPPVPPEGPTSSRPGDSSGRSEQSDVDRLLSAFGSRAGEGKFDPRYDLDGDGAIGANDLSRLLELGGSLPPPGR
ncbi:MAG: hypothetical protein IBJ11_00630 [Phycisphaerales bacterium]|nr:hypothetical protein [Phycisphaerales bacterium]